MLILRLRAVRSWFLRLIVNVVICAPCCCALQIKSTRYVPIYSCVVITKYDNITGTQLPRLGGPNSTPPCSGLSSRAGTETQLPRLGAPISVPPSNPHWPAWKGRP